MHPLSPFLKWRPCCLWHLGACSIQSCHLVVAHAPAEAACTCTHVLRFSRPDTGKANCTCRPARARQPAMTPASLHPPAASVAWRAFLAPGIGSAPLQIVQLMATCAAEAAREGACQVCSGALHQHGQHVSAGDVSNAGKRRLQLGNCPCGTGGDSNADRTISSCTLIPVQWQGAE